VAGGTLWVVATPIGNLGDVTLRALDVLRAVPLVAAEDTRLTRRLWARHGITTRLVSYHARSGPARQEELLAHLRAGADLALVTDAGTPLVSDPGEGLVAAWAAEGGRVVSPPASLRRAGGSRASCPGAGASGGSGWTGSPATSGRRSCSRRRGGPRPRCAISPRRAGPNGAAPCAAS
jgi:16S rRNA (cytidine1402-2'-O)-methyltransferase